MVAAKGRQTEKSWHCASLSFFLSPLPAWSALPEPAAQGEAPMAVRLYGEKLQCSYGGIVRRSYASFAACSRVAWKVSFGQRSWVRRRFTPEVARKARLPAAS